MTLTARMEALVIRIAGEFATIRRDLAALNAQENAHRSQLLAAIDALQAQVQQELADLGADTDFVGLFEAALQQAADDPTTP